MVVWETDIYEEMFRKKWLLCAAKFISSASLFSALEEQNGPGLMFWGSLMDKNLENIRFFLLVRNGTLYSTLYKNMYTLMKQLCLAVKGTVSVSFSEQNMTIFLLLI